MENATAAGSSQSNVSRVYILKRQKRKNYFLLCNRQQSKEKKRSNNLFLKINQ